MTFFVGSEIVKIKICGIKSLDAAKTAETYGADYIGFVFLKGRHRYIEPEKAAEISKNIKSVKQVGVFVDEDPDYVNRVASLCGLDYVQLHGHEDEEYASQIKFPIIKAYRYGENFSVEQAERFPAEIILIDSFVKGKAGGTGTAFNWQEAAEGLRGLKKPFMVAGGISKENAAEALKMFSPFGLDVSGSLEINGEKSPRLIQEFLCSVK